MRLWHLRQKSFVEGKDSMIGEKTPLSEIMRQAYRQGILIPAFNIAYIPMIKPIVESLKKHRTFGLVEVARPDVEKLGASSFQEVAEKYYVLGERMFTRLHLDHIPVIDEDGEKVDWEHLIQIALDFRYDSVMIDGSFLPFDGNVKVTKKVVDYAHQFDVTVEGELGVLAGIEDDVKAEESHYTDPDEVEDFVHKTGVDSLAISIGTSHGAYKFKGASKLDLKRLKEIKKKTGISLVLHGASAVPASIKSLCIKHGCKIEKAKGVSDSSIRAAIKGGINKVNIDTDLRLAFTAAVRRSLRKNPRVFDPRNVLGSAIDELQRVVENTIKLFGSQNKA